MEATALATNQRGEIMESVIIKGDLSKLSPEERAQYYAQVCQSIGLNPLTKPFEYITLNGKLTLYARKDATDQLRNIKGVSVSIAGRERIDDVYLVTALARTPDGRTDESIGAVAIAGLKGDNLANAFMKAETKAKRRVTLSICGLGMLDETEIETIPTTATENRPAIAQNSPRSAPTGEPQGKPAPKEKGPSQREFEAIFPGLKSLGVTREQIAEKIAELCDGEADYSRLTEGDFAGMIPEFAKWENQLHAEKAEAATA